MIWIELVCDGCSYNPFGSRYRRDSVKDLKMRAKLAGWKVINGSLYCPKCQQKIKEAMRNESAD